MTRAFHNGLKIAVFVVPFVGALPAGAQDDAEGAFDRTPQDCIVTNNIDQTEAIDDQNIIFRMNGRRAYRNHLPRKCPGLERENRFSYETHSSRLCSIDTITVLEQFGVGFRPGFTCRLGEFVPLSPEEIEDLERQEDEAQERGGRRRARGAQSAVETRTIDDGRPAESDETGESAPAEAENTGDAAPAPADAPN